MNKTYLIIGTSLLVLLSLLILVIPKSKVLEFSGVVVRELPKNAVIVEKDLTVSERIKELYEEGQLYVFEGSVILSEKKENEAWKQASDKARQELATFLGARISSDSSLKEKTNGIRSAFGYSQDVDVVVNNFVSSSKIIAKWKIPLQKGMFEYHVLVYYDPEALTTFVSKQEKEKLELFFIVYNAELSRIVKLEKLDDISKYKKEFDLVRKNGNVVMFEVKDNRVISRNFTELNRIISKVKLPDGKFRALYSRIKNQIVVFLIRE